MRLYAIYDRLAQESGPIYEAKNDAVAWRMIKQHIQNYNPEEYQLMCLGYYDHDPVGISVFTPPQEVVGFTVDHVEDDQSVNGSEVDGFSTGGKK